MVIILLTLSAVLGLELKSVYTPSMIHLAWGNTTDAMTATWSSTLPSTSPEVQYTPISGPHTEPVIDYKHYSSGTWETFVNDGDDTGSASRTMYSCWAVMTGLEAGQYYQYRVGSPVNGWSKAYYFQAKRDDDAPFKFIVYGDMGVPPESQLVLSKLYTEAKNYDAIIHVGDMAYDLDSNLSYNGDTFMESIEPLAAYMPYMTAQGNHEDKSSGVRKEYEKRFRMPGNAVNRFYAFTAGITKFIVFTDEFIFDKKHHDEADMIAFLNEELTTGRDQYPWVVCISHRPMYCSADSDDCGDDADELRGVFEDLFYNGKVDLFLNGHVHYYERLGPAYDKKGRGCEYEDQNTCRNANAPLNIISGMAGQSHSYEKIPKDHLDWSKCIDDQKGYGTLTIYNSTHLLWQQILAYSGSVVDYLWLIKD